MTGCSADRDFSYDRRNDTGQRSRVTNTAAGGASCLPPLAALSSTDFLHKRNTVVKNTTKAKVRKKSQKVEIDYVNQNEYFASEAAVEKCCGKVCGECGKLMVFNRYSASLRSRCRCITGRIMKEFPRLQGHYVISERKGIPEELWRKSWAGCERGCKKRGGDR